MSVLGAFHVNTASTASGSGLTPCLSTILAIYLTESLRISHFDGLHFNPALFMHPKTSSSQSMWSSRGGCCYDHVIHVTHHKDPYFFVRAISHRKVAVALHKPKGILFHWYNLNSHANHVFSLSFFRRGTCLKAEPKNEVQCCIPIAIDTDCVRSRSTAAKIITSGQNRDLEVYTKSELATIMIFAFLISALSYAAKMVSSFLIALNPPYL